MICIYRTDNITKADLIKAQLESFGIPTYVKTNDASGAMPYLRSINLVEVCIHPDDLEEAKQILEKQRN